MNDLVRPGAIISGTLLPSDLIPAFVSELERLDPHAASEFRQYRRKHQSEFLPDAPEHDLGTLRDLLDEQAGDDLYFGARDDGGSNFGFWPVRREAVPA